MSGLAERVYSRLAIISEGGVNMKDFIVGQEDITDLALHLSGLDEELEGKIKYVYNVLNRDGSVSIIIVRYPDGRRGSFTSISNYGICGRLVTEEAMTEYKDSINHSVTYVKYTEKGFRDSEFQTNR